MSIFTTVPSMEECLNLNKSNSYTVIPITLELYADNITPILLLNRLNELSYNSFLLESVEGGEKWSRYSFLGYSPIKTLECKDNIVKENGKEVNQTPIAFIRDDLKNYKSPKFKTLPPFTGGYVGFFSYDSVKYFEPAIKMDSEDSLGLPDIKLMLFDKIICFDHFRQKISIIININTDDIEKNYKIAIEEFTKILGIIKNGEQLSAENPIIGKFSSNFTKDEYKDKVIKLKEYIRNGDIFQAVLAQRFKASFKGSLLNVYRVLRTKNPSPYMYFLNFGDIEIAGASPETLVKISDGKIYSCPIAGTRPRGKNAEDENAIIEDLLSDEKELAEHNMLVDLARNDVGRVAKFGSVKVPEYMAISKYSHVIHITSLVTGEIADNKDSLDVFESVFPAGTLSGAPKIRAINILDEMEQSKRGIYGGAIGYIDFNGNLDMCIAIRTIVKKDDEISIGVGAGIVYDSVPETEYQETLNKAGAMFQALETASTDNF